MELIFRQQRLVEPESNSHTDQTQLMIFEAKRWQPGFLTAWRRTMVSGGGQIGQPFTKSSGTNSSERIYIYAELHPVKVEARLPIARTGSTLLF
jgi:hypothetical protein